jgi:hypothetical protein
MEKGCRVKPKREVAKVKGDIDVAALFGRIGPEAPIFRSRKAGPLADRRTRRNRTRAAQKRRAIHEEEGSDSAGDAIWCRRFAAA